MENSQNRNLEIGSNYLITEPVKKLLPRFAIPCVISLIISCLYNIVDQIFVGNGIGYLGNAATGVIFPITVIGWGLSLLFGDGAAAYLSLSNGKGDTRNVNHAIGNSMLMSFLTGLILIIICYVSKEPLLRTLGATDSTIGLAKDYGYIIYAMLPIALVQNCLAAIIRADGAPKYALISMIVGAVINIVLDPIAIFVFDLGIKGAAYATIFGQFVSFIICILYFGKSKTFKLKLSDFIPSLQAIRPVLPLGASSFLTQISIVIVTIINNILLVKFGAQSAYGEDIPLAAFVVIMKLFQIILNIAIGIAAGAQPIIGFNYGARRYDRVKKAFKYVILWIVITSIIATFLVEACPLAFIQLFGADGKLYTEFATKCLRIYLSLILFTCVQKAISIFLQSIGKTIFSIPLSIIRDVVFLLLFSIILANIVGVTGIFWAAPIADSLSILVTLLVFISILKKMK